MSRILNLIASSDDVPTQADPEFANYTKGEQRIILKSGGDKGKLLKLYRRVKIRGAFMSPALCPPVGLVAGGDGPGPEPPAGDPLTFTDSGSYIFANTPVTNNAFGQSVIMDNMNMWVSETGHTSSQGRVLRYRKSFEADDWTAIASTSPTTTGSGQAFGYAMAYNHYTLAVGTGYNHDKVEVFTTSDGTLSSQQEITPSALTSGSFGIGVGLYGDHMLIGSPDSGSFGGFEYWSRSGATWSYNSNVTGTDFAGRFGQGIALTDDSTAFVVGEDTTNGHFFIHKYTRSATTWSFDSEIWDDPDAELVGNPFEALSLTTDGQWLVLGDSQVTGRDGLIIVLALDGTVANKILGPTSEGAELGGGGYLDGNLLMAGCPRASSAFIEGGIREYSVTDLGNLKAVANGDVAPGAGRSLHGQGTAVSGNILIVSDSSHFRVYRREDITTDWTFLLETDPDSGDPTPGLTWDGGWALMCTEVTGTNRVRPYQQTNNGQAWATFPAIVPGDDSLGSDSAVWGESLGLSGDHGLIADPEGNGNKGKVLYYERVSAFPGAWTYRSAFEAAETDANQNFGQGVAMTDESTAYITRWDSGDNTTMEIQKWTRSGTTWSYDSKFTVDYSPSQTSSAPALSLDTNGTNFIMGQGEYDNGGGDDGRVIIFDNTGTILQTIVVDDALSTAGQGVSLSNGSAVVGIPNSGADNGNVKTFRNVL